MMHYIAIYKQVLHSKFQNSKVLKGCHCWDKIKSAAIPAWGLGVEGLTRPLNIGAFDRISMIMWMIPHPCTLGQHWIDYLGNSQVKIRLEIIIQIVVTQIQKDKHLIFSLNL